MTLAGNSTTLPLSDAPKPRLSEEQKIDWLRLIRTEGVGPVTFRELLNRYGGAGAALEALPHLLKRSGRIGPVVTRAEAEDELARADALGARLVALGEPHFPARLAALDVPPPLLYVQGRAELVERHAVAMVGSRNGSTAGRRITHDIARDLGEAGLVVVSGLARGIDGAAHQAALETGTIAVLAGGIDHIYPPEHRDLHGAIAEQGLLVSERAPGAPPRSEDFPRRNRIISGIAAGVIVVEAATRSGSLITSRLAAEQGREVFAVPGHPLDPRAKGTLGLIASGATMCRSAADVLDALRPILSEGLPEHIGPSAAEGESPDMAWPDPDDELLYEEPADATERVLAALTVTPVEIDALVRDTALPVWTVRAVLMELDLSGRIERHGLQAVSLATDPPEAR